ncbi:unnamed protein product, partial [marine sediment metagenome]
AKKDTRSSPPFTAGKRVTKQKQSIYRSKTRII